MNFLHTHFYRSRRSAISVLFVLHSVVPAGAQAQAIKEPTKLDISIHAAAGVNPTEEGPAAPIKVRIYELKSDAAFKEADFFSLQDNDKTVLGADLLDKDEFILRPGESKAIRKVSYSAATAIGVLAAYRDLPNATWRAVYTLPDAPEAAWYRFALPSPKAALAIELQAEDIDITEIK